MCPSENVDTLSTLSSSCISLSIDSLYCLEFLEIASLAKCYSSGRETNQPKRKGLGKGKTKKIHGILWTAVNLTCCVIAFKEHCFFHFTMFSLESGFEKYVPVDKQSLFVA